MAPSIVGTSGDDILISRDLTTEGGRADDTLEGGGGNDTLDGGDGTDTAIFSGASTDYTISFDGATYTVSDNRAGAPDGTDLVTNVENFQFSNGTFAVQGTPDYHTLVSVDSAGVQGNDDSSGSISADGRYAVFYGYASNLVADDSNNAMDVFVRDLASGTTTRVSVDGGGAQGDANSFFPSISADGRYVAFQSVASNLVAGDTNGVTDVFVHDLVSGTTTLVSVSTAGDAGNGASFGFRPSISADGRYVAFQSDASNLVAGDANGATDVFVRDLVSGTTTLVSVSSAGLQGDDGSYAPSISEDGRYVAYDSLASNLVAGDTNGVQDVFVRDLVSGTIARVSVSTAGDGGNGSSYLSSISADGRYVAFQSDASNLVAGDTNGATDVFVRDLVSGTTTLVSVSSAGLQGNNNSENPSISADGRYVVFDSFASNLVDGDTDGWPDIFVRDLVSGTTERLSDGLAGVQGNNTSYAPSISADGRYVAFYSFSSNLVADDTNDDADVFVSDREQTGATLSGGVGPDFLIGRSGPDILSGNLGDDMLSGGAGNDVLQGGPGSDYLDGGAGYDVASYADAAAGVNVDLSIAGAQDTSGAGTDTLVNIEYLVGSSYADTLKGDGVHSAYLAGGAGNDVLYSGPAADFLDGGTGNDTVSYANVPSAVNVDLSITGSQDTGGGGADQLVNIKNLAGTAYNDTLTGDAGNNELDGGGGNNILSGGSGNDVLYSGPGNDTLDGGAGYDVASYDNATAGVNVNLSITGPQNTIGAGTDTLVDIEYLVGSAYADTLKGDGVHSAFLSGGAGNDYLQGGPSADYLVGGPGYDVASYSNATAGVTVDLSITGPQNTVGAGVDQLVSIEYLIGSSYADTLKGDGVHSAYLAGGAGDDTLQGGTSADYLVGGTGNDTLSGGGGGDTFAFTKGDGLDTVTDFSITGPNSDTLALSGYGVLSFAALQPLISQSGANTLIAIDAQNHITLLNVQATQLTAGNFQLH